MRTENPILWSFLRGVIISGILISFHMFISDIETSTSNVGGANIDVRDDSPANNTRDEAKFSNHAYSIRSIGHIAIHRETLCLFEIIFGLEGPSGEVNYSIPSPLLGYLRTLLTHSISVNAP